MTQQTSEQLLKELERAFFLMTNDDQAALVRFAKMSAAENPRHRVALSLVVGNRADDRR
jgi:hypothetical protein